MAKLRVLRLNAGLSQKELAEQADVTVDTISRLETGKGKRPYPSTRRRIAAVLGVPIAEVDARCQGRL
jgi:transcriptional regulator with XRE-family HTH domain